MKIDRSSRALAAALGQGRAQIIPGAYDALSAKLVEEAGYELVYVGSYATAAAGFALPDVGALTLDQLVAHARTVVDAVGLPVVADAEGGFFEAPNIWRTVRAFEEAGVAAIHIEDHAGGKHTNLPQSLIALDTMLQRLKAAMDARKDRDLAIIARTDAIWATRNPDEAIRRMNAFAGIGIEYVFPTGATPDFLRALRGRLQPKTVVIDLPSVRDPAEWDGAADLVIDYGFCLQVAAKALKAALALRRSRARAAEIEPLLEDAATFEARLGYAEFTERAVKYTS